MIDPEANGTVTSGFSSSVLPLPMTGRGAVKMLSSSAPFPQLLDAETQRRLDELRFVLADIADVAPSALRWDRIRIDRTSRRWQVLLDLAKLFLRREWQATHRDAARDGGVTLLFPMHTLFEAYVAALLRRALAGTGIEVSAQRGLEYCLGDWARDASCTGHTFQKRHRNRP